MSRRVSNLARHTWQLVVSVFRGLAVSLSWFVLILLLVACTGRQQNEAPVAAETGIAAAPEFVQFYNEYGGRRTFGDPITEAFRITEDGLLIQYYQNARLEYDNDPAIAPSQRVHTFPLGEWALEGLVEVTPAPVTPNSPSRSFAETGQRLQDEFLSFYETYGGEGWLGSPISPQLEEDGLRVQYFRNGRLEWRPELPRNQRIQVSRLGQAHFDAEMVFAYQRHIWAQPVTYAGVTSANVTAYVRAPILYAGDEQVLYLTVLTQEGRPVVDMPVDATIIYNGVTRVIDLGRTNGSGRLSTRLDLSDVLPGQQVDLHISAYGAAGEVIGGTMLTFKTWW